MKEGDLSVTIRYIDLEKRTRDGSAKLQRSGKDDPATGAKTGQYFGQDGPYLQE